MARRKNDEQPGFGKLLDAWSPPEDAGDPVGCVATTFTFKPEFFEEECLARFLHLESDPTEDGPAYLIEREEKLAGLECAAALVDQHHCRGARSLRWDMISARLPRGQIQHAKVSLLVWSRRIRLLIASANLTEDGYRRNQEVFGVLDFFSGSEAPPSCLEQAIDFLQQVALPHGGVSHTESPALGRWQRLLMRARELSQGWADRTAERRRGKWVQPVFSGPGRNSVLQALEKLRPSGSPPELACVVSPFFDHPDQANRPAEELWRLLRQRGEARVEFHVSAEQTPGEEKVLLHAPRSLLEAQPPRSSVETQFYQVTLESHRPLHAKGIWLENDRWAVYCIGSSNFTTAGLGLKVNGNWEANLAYIVDGEREAGAYQKLEQAFPESEYIDATLAAWQPRTDASEDDVDAELALPMAFQEAVYCATEDGAVMQLTFTGKPPAGWRLLLEDRDVPFFAEADWIAQGQPHLCVVPWPAARPPSGLWATWEDGACRAWWPVNVNDADALPPPDHLKQLPLDVLIDILSSARPLHRVLAEYLRRRERQENQSSPLPVIDPHRRVDTSGFLLQRTRRLASALHSLRVRLQEPAPTLERLLWRLRGPVGVKALAEALHREARSDAERAFLLAELVLELDRIEPETAPGCVPADQHRREVHALLPELRALVPATTGADFQNLQSYVNAVFEKVGA